jgi:hypothetical protein
VADSAGAADQLGDYRRERSLRVSFADELTELRRAAIPSPPRTLRFQRSTTLALM